MQKIGFIGLGIMGRPMAKNLVRAGQELLVNDIDGKAVAELAALGATPATAREIGGNCAVIFTILPTAAIVSDVLFGDGGVLETALPGTVVADMSSVTPGESKACAERLAGKGVAFADAPVSGGEPKAIDGTLAFMVGADADTFDKLTPYFGIMGASAVLVGGVGSGSAAKLANQIIVNLGIAAVSEALVLAAKAGADPEKVVSAIRGGLAGSAVLEAKAPMMLSRNFVPGGKISINHKDIGNVMKTAHEVDAVLPLSAQLFEIMQALKVDGHMNDDHAGLVQYFERLSGVIVQRGGK